MVVVAVIDRHQIITMVAAMEGIMVINKINHTTAAPMDTIVTVKTTAAMEVTTIIMAQVMEVAVMAKAEVPK